MDFIPLPGIGVMLVDKHDSIVTGLIHVHTHLLFLSNGSSFLIKTIAKEYNLKYSSLSFFYTQSVACPFLIDPSSRATEWLRTHLKEHRLEVINQQVNTQTHTQS